jgi:TolA-binding protein
MTDTVKSTISETQTEIRNALGVADQQLVALTGRVEELRLAAEDPQIDENSVQRGDEFQQLEVEREALAASRQLLTELLSKSQEDAVAKAMVENSNGATRVAFGNQNSGFQAGVINGGVSGISFGAK